MIEEFDLEGVGGVTRDGFLSICWQWIFPPLLLLTFLFLLFCCWCALCLFIFTAYGCMNCCRLRFVCFSYISSGARGVVSRSVYGVNSFRLLFYTYSWLSLGVRAFSGELNWIEFTMSTTTNQYADNCMCHPVSENIHVFISIGNVHKSPCTQKNLNTLSKSDMP